MEGMSKRKGQTKRKGCSCMIQEHPFRKIFHSTLSITLLRHQASCKRVWQQTLPNTQTCTPASVKLKVCKLSCALFECYHLLGNGIFGIYTQKFLCHFLCTGHIFLDVVSIHHKVGISLYQHGLLTACQFAFLRKC